jgi:elongation factor G
MEVESASRVVDGAVVLIDSVEGVEAQTKGVWQQLDRYASKSYLRLLMFITRSIQGMAFLAEFLCSISSTGRVPHFIHLYCPR